MRRSKAPSVLSKAKRLCNDYKGVGHTSDPEDEQYNWGSRALNSKNECNENKRIFTVVWRDISTKKHKTWKGDGTLEVNNFTEKAILKDETGKYIGCSTKFNKNDLAPDSQLLIGGKEIEIQNEIIDEDVLHELRKIQNRNLGEEEWISSKEEEKKTKGGFKFKPVLMLKPPKMTSNQEIRLNNETLKSNWLASDDETSSSFGTNIGETKIDLSLACLTNFISKVQTYPNTGLLREFLCFVRPSELQQFLFLKTLEYYSAIKSSLTLEKLQLLDINNILQHICNHPSLINHKSTTNELMRHLIPNLPDWSDMGPFDSGKLEFVQYFLSDLTKHKSENCIIFAKNCGVLNMLQGLCDFMHIKCLRLNSNTLDCSKEEVMTLFCSSENNLTHVLLVNSVEVINSFNYFAYCKKLIIFENSLRNMNTLSIPHKVKEMTVYYLVTAFSIEELLLHDTTFYKNNENLLKLLDELVDMNMDKDNCYLHSKIECKCYENTDANFNTNNTFIKNWRHYKYPFDMQLLKNSFLANSAENIITIFCRNLK